MDLLLEISTKPGNQFPWAFVAVYVVGFVAAVVLGSLAWYKSKRPVGWEDKERPDIVPEIKDDIVPEIKKEETPGI